MSDAIPVTVRKCSFAESNLYESLVNCASDYVPKYEVKHVWTDTFEAFSMAAHFAEKLANHHL